VKIAMVGLGKMGVAVRTEPADARAGGDGKPA